MDPETGRQSRFPTRAEASVYPWWNWMMGVFFWVSLFFTGGQFILPMSLIFFCVRGASWDTDRERWRQYNTDPKGEELPSGTICCDARTYAWIGVASWASIVGLFFLTFYFAVLPFTAVIQLI